MREVFMTASIKIATLEPLWHILHWGTPLFIWRRLRRATPRRKLYVIYKCLSLHAMSNRDWKYNSSAEDEGCGSGQWSLYHHIFLNLIHFSIRPKFYYSAQEIYIFIQLGTHKAGVITIYLGTKWQSVLESPRLELLPGTSWTRIVTE